MDQNYINQLRNVAGFSTTPTTPMTGANAAPMQDLSTIWDNYDKQHPTVTPIDKNQPPVTPEKVQMYGEEGAKVYHSPQENIGKLLSGHIPQVQPLWQGAPKNNFEAVAQPIANIPTSALNFLTGAINFLNPIRNVQSIQESLGKINAKAQQTGQSPLATAWGGATNFPAIGEAAKKNLLPQAWQSIISGDVEGAAKANAEDPVGTWAPLILTMKGLAEAADHPQLKAIENDIKTSNPGLPEDQLQQKIAQAHQDFHNSDQSVSGKIDRTMTGITGKVGETLKPIPEAVGMAKEYVGNKLSAARDYITPMDENVKTVLKNGNPADLEPKLNTLLDQAKTAQSETGAPTPFETTGKEQLGGALQDLNKKLSDLGKQKAETVKQIEALSKQPTEIPQGGKVTDFTQNPVNPALDKLATDFNKSFKTSVSQLGLKVMPDGSVGVQEGVVAKIPEGSADLKTLAQVNKILTDIKKNPTFNNIDSGVDAMQELLYKRKATLGAEPMNSELEGLMKQQIGKFNGQIKDFSKNFISEGIGNYPKINEDYARINDLYNELNKKLGKGSKKAGAVVKQIFSPTDSGTKALIQALEQETGRPIFQDATLSKFVMDLVKDPRAKSLLEGQGVPPTSKAGLVNRLIDYVEGKITNPEAKARNLIEANKPETGPTAAERLIPDYLLKYLKDPKVGGMIKDINSMSVEDINKMIKNLSKNEGSQASKADIGELKNRLQELVKQKTENSSKSIQDFNDAERDTVINAMKEFSKNPAAIDDFDYIKSVIDKAEQGKVKGEDLYHAAMFLKEKGIDVFKPGFNQGETPTTKDIAYHGTTPENAKAIEKSGFKVGTNWRLMGDVRSPIETIEGIHFSTDKGSAEMYGNSIIQKDLGKLKLFDINGKEAKAIMKDYNKLNDPNIENTTDISQSLYEKAKKLGYDGLKDGDLRVVFNPKQIK